MKNKPQRHKETNDFRYKSFGNRINEIDLRRSAFYHIRHENEDISDDIPETEFHQTYCKWIVLNLTEEYAIFHKQVRHIATLPQLLLKKDFVVELLFESIEKSTLLSLQPLLEYVIALARDLRKDFYPYFVTSAGKKSFLSTLINLLNSKEADQLECTLICLAHLFKILKPYVKKDIFRVLNELLPLLDDHSEAVTNFAAECFSFVVRDINDKAGFVEQFVDNVAATESDISFRGCGQLLFEIVRGVKDQFHSCAEAFLPVYFDTLGKIEASKAAILNNVLREMMTALLHTISPANMQLFWNSSYRSLELFRTQSENNELAIIHMLTLMGIALETRDGKYLLSAGQFVTEILQVVDVSVEQSFDECLKVVTNLTAVLLLSKNIIITQLDASRITKRVLTIPSTTIFEAFVWHTVQYSQFEILILPEFMRYLDSKHFGLSALELMAKVILFKSPLAGDGITINQRNTYPIRMKTVKCLQKIESIITAMHGKELTEEKLREFLLAAIIYPHIIGNDPSKYVEQMNEVIEHQLDTLSPHDSQTNGEPESLNARNKNKRCLFILSVLVENCILMRQHVALNGDQKLQLKRLPLRTLVTKLLPFSQCDSYIHGLRLLDMIISHEATLKKNRRDVDFNVKLFVDIHQELSMNLTSRYHTVRRTTAHLFDQFSNDLGFDDERSIYKVFYGVESIEPTIHTYREQLLLFQQIEPTQHLINALQKAHAPLKYDPIKYLLGILYINFNLLWKPISALITAYFDEVDIEEFWTLYKAKIDETTLLQRNAHNDDIHEDAAFIDADSCLATEYKNIWLSTERAMDLVNYRIQLWQLIPKLGMLREIKNREIVTIFLDFVEHEYKKSTDRDSLTWTAQQNRKQKKHKGKFNESVEIMEDIDDDGIVDKAKDDQAVPKGTQRTLSKMLEVFVNQNNPKQMHREPELWNLYMELLTHRNSDIQKLALDCINAYKLKYIQPYKDHLYNLINDSKFKEAISTFNIDKESNILQPEHRPQLMPIVMRILFSKMLFRAGGQKTPNQTRKAIIMRFLGGCHEDEVLIILNMAFWMFERDFKDDPQEMCLEVMTKCDVATLLSPSILQSSLDLIDVIQSEFSGLMSEKFLRYVVNVLLVIGSILQGVVQQSKRADSKLTTDMVKPFKNLRNTCLQNIHRFFEHFDKYNWSDGEIDAIFLIFISPTVAKLHQESVQAVTPLLKLFSTFAKIPRLFVLLTRYTTSSSAMTDTTPLKYVMDLLVEPKARPLVSLCGMEIIQNLLTLSDDDQTDDTARPLQLTQCKEIETHRLIGVPNADALNFGSKILLPYLPNILQKIKMSLRGRRGLTKRDLVILSKITELITDAETSNKLLIVLLPILVRKSSRSVNEEVLVQMINTIINLFNRIERPERHMRSIAPMFEQITAVGPRKLLGDLLSIISERCSSADAEKCKQLQNCVKIVHGLNAWDRRWIEQPDYETRLATYKEIGEMAAAGQIDLNLGLLVIYHSFHFIKYDKDMSLRDSASLHLRSMVPALIRTLQQSRKTHELEYLVGTVLLNMVRRTIRDKNVNVRFEGLQLLGEVARECPTAHPVISDLSLLTSKDDREIDFFDNITHLQIQRHGRALLRFGSVAKTLEKAPHPRTLTQIILPLATAYISNEAHAAKHGLITSAIETVGAVCRLLPWHQYDTILQHYIKKMRYNVQYQKQMVRIVMQILDAFHFDLTTANAENIKAVHAKNVEEANKVKPQLSAIETSKQETDDSTVAIEGEEAVFEADDDEAGEFDDALDAINDKDVVNDEEEQEDIPAKKMKCYVYDTPTILSAGIARKIVQSIASGLIPTLNNSITALSTFESFHKLNKKQRRSEREEEEILRVPIALAVVKLLQKLPPGMLKQHISGILIKVCHFLKSPLISVRMTTRDILKSIMLAVGAEHLETLLGHLTALLTRGFQVHVLTITVHSLLDALKTSLKNGIMDKCLRDVLDVCLRDIFGESGAEKEVTKIGRHTPEAKPHSKSYLSLGICAANLSQSCLLDLLIPFRDNLARSQSKKIVVRVQECFQKIVAGLTTNKQISIETMLMFIYGVISESIPDLLPGIPQPVLSAKEKEKIQRQKPDCFLIPEDPSSNGRTGAVKKVVVTNVRANAHVLIEFGLELLQMTLKREKLRKMNYQPFTDPILPILSDSLKSAHVRVTSFALKCLSKMLEKEMITERLKEVITPIVDDVFGILHKYVAANTDMSNDNFQLVFNSFKTIFNVLRYMPAPAFELSEEQLKILLFYAEQYLNIGEPAKQKIAFSLLKVILGRRLVTKELNDVMIQVGRLAIQSDADTTRHEAKAIIVNYLLEYPLGKKVEGFMEFFVSNLGYEVRSGRESAINILHSMAKRFPPKYLNKNGQLIFVACGTRLVTDDSAECRELVAACLETLISRIDANRRTELFSIVKNLLQDEKPIHREMAALLCTRFINAEKDKFSERVPILQQFIDTLSKFTKGGSSSAPGRFVRPLDIEPMADSDNDEFDEEKAEHQNRLVDHQLIQIQNTILKILERFPDAIRQYSLYVDELAYKSQKLLAHDHVWVRLNALKTIQLILSRINADEVHEILINGPNDKRDASSLNYIYQDPAKEIKSLILDLCAQLVPNQADKEMAQSVTVTLLLVANYLKNVSFDSVSKVDDDEDDADGENAGNMKRAINLPWLVRRLRYVVHAEVAKAPQSTLLRTAVFQWIEGLCAVIDDQQVRKLSYALLASLVREMSEDDQTINAKLRKVAIRVGDSIRARIGDDDYNLLRVQIQQKLMIRRAERKKFIAMEKVSNPAKAANRTQNIRDRKKLAKRRKITAFRDGTAPARKRKKFNTDNDF